MYLKVLRVHIKGWTASFRYPIFISGFQPTLEVPPLSTVYGILSAAKGEYVTPQEAKLGYLFRSSGKFVDLETIYELSDNNNAKSNITKREVLILPELYIYIDNLEFEKYFKNPAYQILLGRSQDIAMVDEVKVIELEEGEDEGYFGGTTVPFPAKRLTGMIQALPAFFTDSVPRKAVGTRPYHVISEIRRIPLKGYYYDKELKIGVYLHDQY